MNSEVKQKLQLKLETLVRLNADPPKPDEPDPCGCAATMSPSGKTL